MSREYLQPEKAIEETGPPDEFKRLSPAQVQNPELWSNSALITMINLGHPRATALIRILQLRAINNDADADIMLRGLNKKAAESCNPHY